ncbi:Uncharacterised protein [uncultured archaeon]|nr:Uncharacterised protein [uncultured archaeon]
MKNTEFCKICNNPVTNPICAKCNTKHFLLWMNKHNLSLKKRHYLLDYIKKNLFFESENNDNCIICNSETIGICSYCFYSKIENILDRLKIAEDIKEDFLQIFNYELFSDESFSLDNPDITCN